MQKEDIEVKTVSVHHQNGKKDAESQGIEGSENEYIAKLRQRSLTTSYCQKRQVQATFKKGKWEKLEERKYLRFLGRNKVRFQDCQAKRKFTVFVRMSHYIGTRDRAQCTSHHQKMIKKYKTLDTILVELGTLLKTGVQTKQDVCIFSSEFEKMDQLSLQNNSRQKMQLQGGNLEISEYIDEVGQICEMVSDNVNNVNNVNKSDVNPIQLARKTSDNWFLCQFDQQEFYQPVIR